MLKNKVQEKKKLILFLLFSLLFALTITGCNWFENGIINIFDPRAQIRVNYTEINLAEGEGSISLEVYSLNEVEFIGEGFSYKYYSNGILIPDLSKTVGAVFYVAPSDSPGSPGDVTEISNMPLYFQEALDYVTMHPLVTELACTITLLGTDGSGHSLTASVTFDLPALQPGVDFVPPTAVINVTPGSTGTAPFTVQFDASASTDDRGIASYSWNFGDGSTGSGVMPAAHTYDDPGSYIVKLTVTDYWGNVGYATTTISVSEAGAPVAVINVVPGTSGVAPFTVYFDASESSIADSGEGCGSCSIESYEWDFGDGDSGTGMTTSHTYTTPGSYNVILTVTDSNNNQGFASIKITVGEAGAPSEITLAASPSTLTAGGGTSNITATVKDSQGNPVTDGTVVNFTASLGSLSAESVNTTGGIAQTVLTLTNLGTEEISSTISAVSGSANKSIVVYCPPPTP